MCKNAQKQTKPIKPILLTHCLQLQLPRITIITRFSGPANHTIRYHLWDLKKRLEELSAIWASETGGVWWISLRKERCARGAKRWMWGSNEQDCIDDLELYWRVNKWWGFCKNATFIFSFVFNVFCLTSKYHACIPHTPNYAILVLPYHWYSQLSLYILKENWKEIYSRINVLLSETKQSLSDKAH